MKTWRLAQMMHLASGQMKKKIKFFSVHLFTKVYEPLLINIKQDENTITSNNYTKCKQNKIKNGWVASQ